MNILLSNEITFSNEIISIILMMLNTLSNEIILPIRYLYWTNGKRRNGSIERSRLDATERTLVIKDNLYEVIGITIDYEFQKVYWVDDMEGIHYKIERSNLDGSEREVVHQGVHQQPLFLVIIRDNIFWTDLVSRQIWTLPKNPKSKTKPKLFKAWDSYLQSPVSLAISNEKVNCTTIGEVGVRSMADMRYNTEEMEESQCSARGNFSKAEGICFCQPG